MCCGLGAVYACGSFGVKRFELPELPFTLELPSFEPLKGVKALGSLSHLLFVS